MPFSIENLSILLQKHYKAVITTFLVILVGINVSPGLIIMGLDNASPFFSFDTLWYQIIHSSNFFEFGPLLFTPTLLFTLFPIPAWVISQIFYFGSFLVGIFFTITIVETYLETNNLHSIKSIVSPLIIVFILGSLISLWIYSQPIILFASAFAGIPAVIQFLTEKTKPTFVKVVFQAVGLLFFFSTSINPVAFIVFSICILILSLFIGLKKDFHNVFIKCTALLLLWIVIIQSLLIISGRNSFIVTELIDYGREIQNDPKTIEVTESLQSAEIQRNSLTNVLRFGTSWMLLNKGDGQRIFEFEPIYDTLLFVIIGIIPPLALIIISYQTKQKFASTRVFIMLWFIAQILMTGYIMIFLKNVDILNQLLRWNSTKIWPLAFYSLIFLIPSMFLGLFESKFAYKRWALCIFVVLLCFSAFPWWTGKIIGSTSKVIIPQVYSQIPIESGSRVLVVPGPQRLYMKEYSWGYFGTDFFPYFYPAEFISNGGFHSRHHSFSDYVKKYESCTLVSSEVTYVLFDGNTLGTSEMIPDCYKERVLWQKEKLLLIKV